MELRLFDHYRCPPRRHGAWATTRRTCDRPKSTSGIFAVNIPPSGPTDVTSTVVEINCLQSLQARRMPYI